MSQPVQTEKQTTLVVLFSILMMVVLLFFVGWMSIGDGEPAPLEMFHQILLALAVFSAIGCFICYQSRLKPFEQAGQSDLPTPARWRTDMLLCAVLGEFPSLMGLVITFSTREVLIHLVLSALSIGLIVTFCLLPTLRYFQMLEQQQ